MSMVIGIIVHSADILVNKFSRSRSRVSVTSSAMAAVFPANQVIVVGGGLAGMSAANQVIENGGAVVGWKRKNMKKTNFGAQTHIDQNVIDFGNTY